jgi:signal peptidase II
MADSGVSTQPRPISKVGLLAYFLAFDVILLDQASKYWIVKALELPVRGTLPVAGPLNLTFVQNRGVSFGLLAADHDIGRWALTAFAVVVAVVLAAWVRRADRPLFAASLGLMIGGALGNAIDRVRFGRVVDFIDVQRLGFPWIFNIADAALNIGVVLLLLDSLRKDPKARAG